jgi:glycine betaine/proline transport system ATP-binding protein
MSKTGSDTLDQTHTQPLQSPLSPIAVSCRNVWKLFGGQSDKSAKIRLRPSSDQDLAASGLVPAVRDVSLDIFVGEIFTIMGLSGSGKSTLLRCLTRLTEPSYGSISVEGRELLGMSARELIELRRHRIGMVFQNFALLPHLTVLQNVAFPLSVQGIPKQQRLDRARQMVELVGLNGRENFYPRELSGGQQQRVGIARSLSTDPSIWFLDEPFSALDPLIRREMQTELLRLQSVLHKTIIFITHDFDEAVKLSDRIAIMKDGVVIQVGTPEQIVTFPATEYVAEFTQDVQLANVVTAGSIMTKSKSSQYAQCIGVNDRLADFMRDLVSSGGPFGVRDKTEQIAGEVTVNAVTRVLAGLERR